VGPNGMFEAAQSLMRARVSETVEYVEDSSLGYQCGDPHYSALDPVLAAPLALYGCGADDGYYRPGLDRYMTDTIESDGGVVRLERIPSTEDYDVTVLNASTPAALTEWLDANAFRHDEYDDSAFASYVRDGGWFVAINIHPPDRAGEHVALRPLVVTFRGGSIPLTHRLQYDPRGATTFTDAFIIAPWRVDAMDDSGITEYAAPASGSPSFPTHFDQAVVQYSGGVFRLVPSGQVPAPGPGQLDL